MGEQRHYPRSHSGGTFSPKDKILLSLTEQSETAKVPSDKRIAEVEKFIIDPRMVSLLKETPKGIRQKEINDASGEGLTELRVNTLGAVGISWIFDKSKLTQNQDLGLYYSYKDLKKFIGKFSLIGIIGIAGLFLNGFEQPGFNIFMLGYLLLPTVLLVILISKLLKIKSIIYSNLVFILLLFVTVPVLGYILFYSLNFIFGATG